MIKLLKSIIVLLVLTSGGFFITFKSLEEEESIPTHLYHEEKSLNDLLLEELDDSIEDVKNGENFHFNLSEDQINEALYYLIREYINDSYNPGTICTESKCKYIIEEDINILGKDGNVKVSGLKLDIIEDLIILNAYVKIDHLIDISTVVKGYFKFQENKDFYSIKLEKVKLGKITVPKVLVKNTLKRYEKKLKTDLGYVDFSKLELVIQKDKIVKKFIDLDEEYFNDSIDLGIDFLYRNKLIDLELKKDELVLNSNINLFRSSENSALPDYLEEMFTYSDEVALFDNSSYSKIEEIEYLVYEMLIKGIDSENKIEIDEEFINKFILSETKEIFKKSHKVDIKNYSYNASFDGIWLEVFNNNLYINGLFDFEGVKSLVKIMVENISTDNDKLKLKLGEVSIVKNRYKDDYIIIKEINQINYLLSNFGDTKYGTFTSDGSFVIDVSKITNILKHDSHFYETEIKGIYIENNKLYVEINAINNTYNSFLSTYKDELKRAIVAINRADYENILDGNNELESVLLYNLEKALESLKENKPSFYRYVDETFKLFDSLDNEKKQEIINLFKSKIDSSLLKEFEAIILN